MKPQSTQILTTKVALVTDFKQPLIALEEQCDSAAGYVAVSDPKKEVFAYSHQNGFFNAAALAYNNHLHLRLRPDDIWLTIAQGISAHINNGDNAEKFRHLFVTHEGQAEIAVVVELFRTDDSTLFHWDKCVDSVVDKLSGRVLGGITDVLLCDFTTTNTTAKTASQIVLMDAMKKYFTYRMICGCAIPKVTLEGTVEDWKRLQEKLKQAKALRLEGIEEWLSGLEPVLQELVNTYEGKVNEDFWSHIMDKHVAYGGSGMRLAPPDSDLHTLPDSKCMYSGWIVNFFPYSDEGRKLSPNSTLNSKDVPSGRVTVPFILEDVSTGEKLKMRLTSGFLGTVQNDDDGSLAPYIGWAVAKEQKDNVQPPVPRRV